MAKAGRLCALLAALCLLFFSACGESAGGASASGYPHTSVSAPKGDTLVITDRLFIAQTNDIYYNHEDYLDKTIQYEGLYKCYDMPDIGEMHFVVRYGPGCCGIDGEAGFEVLWDGGWPQIDDWVQATGTLEVVEHANGRTELKLRLSALDVLPQRGQETVTT